jgi:chromosome segregation ATPase
MIDCLVA